MAYVSELFKDTLVFNKNGENVDLKPHCTGKIVGLYFSGNWCPSCKGFTPVLTHYYENNKEFKNFEIIFISADRTESSFKQYYSKCMPWLALSYEFNIKMTELCDKFKINSVPSLVLLNGDDGFIYNYDAIKHFNDFEIDNFPWQSSSITK